MKFLFIAFITIITFSQTLEADPRNLVNLKQDFVLQTKKINIPGYPDAFNPSVVSWRGRLLMSFRTHDPVTLSTDAIGLVWLDQNFEPISEPKILMREGEVSTNPSKAQDPRLLVVGPHVYIVYSNLYPHEEPVNRMIVGLIENDINDGFRISYPSNLLHFYGQIAGRKEKNWIPFSHGHRLYFAYSLQPHRIFMPLLDINSCLSIGSSIGSIKWDWGNLMGGTPALQIGDSYLGFFHSNKALATVQSDGEVMNHYFMGAYTFESSYPFAITGISPHPIVARTFYEGKMYDDLNWKPLRVVFPGGFIADENYIWVVYGRQDHESWVVKLDKAKLLDNLVPVDMIKFSIQ
jgi:predicted GH43/DUF377 family glycosyl hydrolase